MPTRVHNSTKGTIRHDDFSHSINSSNNSNSNNSNNNSSARRRRRRMHHNHHHHSPPQTSTNNNTPTTESFEWFQPLSNYFHSILQADEDEDDDDDDNDDDDDDDATNIITSSLCAPSTTTAATTTTTPAAPVPITPGKQLISNGTTTTAVHGITIGTMPTPPLSCGSGTTSTTNDTTADTTADMTIDDSRESSSSPSPCFATLFTDDQFYTRHSPSRFKRHSPSRFKGRNAILGIGSDDDRPTEEDGDDDGDYGYPYVDEEGEGMSSFCRWLTSTDVEDHVETIAAGDIFCVGDDDDDVVVVGGDVDVVVEGGGGGGGDSRHIEEMEDDILNEYQPDKSLLELNDHPLDRPLLQSDKPDNNNELSLGSNDDHPLDKPLLLLEDQHQQCTNGDVEISYNRNDDDDVVVVVVGGGDVGDVVIEGGGGGDSSPIEEMEDGILNDYQADKSLLELNYHILDKSLLLLEEQHQQCTNEDVEISYNSHSEVVFDDSPENNICTDDTRTSIVIINDNHSSSSSQIDASSSLVEENEIDSRLPTNGGDESSHAKENESDSCPSVNGDDGSSCTKNDDVVHSSSHDVEENENSTTSLIDGDDDDDDDDDASSHTSTGDVDSGRLGIAPIHPLTTTSAVDDGVATPEEERKDANDRGMKRLLQIALESGLFVTDHAPVDNTCPWDEMILNSDPSVDAKQSNRATISINHDMKQQQQQNNRNELKRAKFRRRRGRLSLRVTTSNNEGVVVSPSTSMDQNHVEDTVDRATVMTCQHDGNDGAAKRPTSHHAAARAEDGSKSRNNVDCCEAIERDVTRRPKRNEHDGVEHDPTDIEVNTEETTQQQRRAAGWDRTRKSKRDRLRRRRAQAGSRIATSSSDDDVRVSPSITTKNEDLPPKRPGLGPLAIAVARPGDASSNNTEEEDDDCNDESEREKSGRDGAGIRVWDRPDDDTCRGRGRGRGRRREGVTRRVMRDKDDAKNDATTTNNSNGAKQQQQNLGIKRIKLKRTRRMYNRLVRNNNNSTCASIMEEEEEEQQQLTSSRLVEQNDLELLVDATVSSSSSSSSPQCNDSDCAVSSIDVVPPSACPHDGMNQAMQDDCEENKQDGAGQQFDEDIARPDNKGMDEGAQSNKSDTTTHHHHNDFGTKQQYASMKMTKLKRARRRDRLRIVTSLSVDEQQQLSSPRSVVDRDHFDLVADSKPRDHPTNDGAKCPVTLNELPHRPDGTIHPSNKVESGEKNPDDGNAPAECPVLDRPGAAACPEERVHHRAMGAKGNAEDYGRDDATNAIDNNGTKKQQQQQQQNVGLLNRKKLKHARRRDRLRISSKS